MKKILYIWIVALGAISCSEDFLETKSTQSADQTIMFSNTSNARMAINGIHRLMYEASGATGTTTSWYGQGGYQTFILNLEMMGEDLVYTKTNPVFQTAATWTFHRDKSNKDLIYNYRLFYRIIANSNMIIDNIDGAEGLQQDRDEIKAQALVYRAFSHFNLVQCFGKRYLPGQINSQLGVVIKTDNGLEMKARNSVEEVYVQINQDLDDAILLLETVTNIRLNKSHINLTVARGMKARVLLTQGKWEEAATMARLAINESGAALQLNTYTTIVNRMSDQTNTEWLWGKFALEDQAGTLRDFHAFISNRNVSYNRNTPRCIYNKLYDQITSTDVRKKLWFPSAQDPSVVPRPIIPTAGNRRNYMSNKFIVAIETQACADVPYMRLPELILIEAEGLARAGKFAEAADALYPLARHRDPSYVKSVLTGDPLIDEIMVQRRIELWGEGFRWFDLKRLNLPLDRGPAPRAGYSIAAWNNSNVMPINVDPLASNYNMYDEQGMGEANRYRAADSNEWEWLFPNVETDVNPLIIQNPL